MPTPPVHALNQLRQLGLGFAVSRSFFAACEMGIFDRLAGKPASAGSLAQQLEIHPEGCRRLLVVLHRLGLLTRNGDEFSNTELAGFLTSDSPFRMNGLGIPSGVPASRRRAQVRGDSEKPEPLPPTAPTPTRTPTPTTAPTPARTRRRRHRTRHPADRACERRARSAAREPTTSAEPAPSASGARAERSGSARALSGHR